MTDTLREQIARLIGYNFASLVSRNNMPDMSGDPRKRIPAHERRRFDDACEETADQLLALLPSLPDGFVAVPLEPTEAMKRAGGNALGGWVAPAMHPDHAYRAMLSARPTVVEGPQEEDEDPPCTDCGGTGINNQTERTCSCVPPTEPLETER